MGNGRKHRVAQTLGLHLHCRVLGDLDIMHPLQGNGDQRGKGIKQSTLLGDQQAVRIAHFECQYAAQAHRCLERQVKDRAGSQRVGALAGRLGMIESPLGNTQVDGGQTVGRGQGRLQAVVVVGQHKGRPCTEFGDDEAFADFGNLLGHQCAGKVA